ncbi:MAG TPA: polymer-forming cytoskeletal protein [Rhizomicrobium sp.]|nr:polymer-forming cytoskeletal protein [Rhizomicrobium sp.]
MFSSKSKDPVPPPASIPPLANPAPKRAGRSGTVPSIISADLTVTGTLNSTGDMQIDGIVEGDVRSVGLVIGERAEIHGEIWAEDVTVRGKVIGRIRARKVLLSATSHVEGDILHEAFAVEAGAFFEGNCRHSDNPLGDEVRKVQPSSQSLSAQPGLAGLTPLQAT